MGEPPRRAWRLPRSEEGKPDQGFIDRVPEELPPCCRYQSFMSTVSMPPSRGGGRNQGIGDVNRKSQVTTKCNACGTEPHTF